MRRWRVHAAVGALLGLVVIVETGCWGRQFFRSPSATLETSSKVDSLLKENAILKERVASLERAMKENAEVSRAANAERKMDLDELKDQLNALQEMIREGQGSPFKPAERRRATRPDTIRAEPAARPGAGSAGPSPPATAPRGDTAQAVPVRVPRDTFPGSAGPADTSGARAAAPPPPEEMFRQIYLDYNRRGYPLALEESESFLKEYPDDPLAEEVLFIRGECFMELANYLDALKEFSALLQRYPGGKRAPGALLRMAVSYDTMGQKEVAAGVARRLIKEYPHSEEAAAAQERFKDILKE